MATPEEVAGAYQADQKRTALAATAAALSLWERLDEDALTQSWDAGVGQTLVEAVTRAQYAAAAQAPAYLEDLAAAQGALAEAAAIVPAALAGVASDGRPLASLLYLPIMLFKRLLGLGQPRGEAMRQARNFLAVATATQVADAGRAAVSVGMAAGRTWTSYVRVVNLPACSRCIILAGREYSWSTGFQRHPACFPAGTMVSGPGSRAATRRWYEGELVILATASGQQLSATGNHPILTDRGWVPANLLQPGDHVIRSVLGEGAVPLVVPDERQMPALIEDLWDADGVVLRGVPTSSDDFHGDGGDGDVDVVFTDGLLRDRIEAAQVQPVEHYLLAEAGALAYPFAPEGLLTEILVATRHALDRLMGGGGLGCSRFRGHLGGPDFTRIGHVADLDAMRDKTWADHIAAHSVADAEAVLAFASLVSGGYLFDRQVGSRSTGTVRWDAPGSHGDVEDARAYASRGLDLLDRLTGDVELDRVLDVRRVDWRGHVYNLTSTEGWYAANSLIVSNCDCTMTPRMVRADGSTSGPAPMDPMELFDSMPAEEQDRRFGKAGAEAIRLGSDMGQVVNARRGMRTAGGRLVTAEGTTRRGIAGRRMGSVAGRRMPVRPMPEQILKDADGDRDEAIRLLQRFGYLLEAPRPARGIPAVQEAASSPGPSDQPEPQIAPTSLIAATQPVTPIIPVPPQAQPYHRSLEGIQALARAVESGPPRESRVLGGGMAAATVLVTLADGTRAVRKSAKSSGGVQDGPAEQAASMVARALGLAAPAVYRNSPDSIYMEFVEGAATADELLARGEDERVERARNSDGGRIVGLLDVLTFNYDRNSGNWMITDSGEIIPIDHGVAYVESGDVADHLQYLHDFAEQYTDGPNPLTAEDMAEVRRRLEGLRQDFQHIGKGAWLEHSLKMLDLLEPQATGTKNLVAGVR